MGYCQPPKNRVKTQFSSTYQPKNRHTGPFAVTILRKLVEATPTEYRNALTGINEKGVLAIPMCIAMVKKVLEDGDVAAFREIMDRLYGKTPTPSQEVPQDEACEHEIKIVPDNGETKETFYNRFRKYLS